MSRTSDLAREARRWGDVHDHVGEKRLIFCLTTGRSGTGYLASVLGVVPGVVSSHEALPEFADVMREAQADASVARRFWVDKKLPAIAQVREGIYVETSHLMCKGFVEPLLDLGLIPDAIVLMRPHREVALSLWRLRTVPGRTAKGLKYYLSPADPGVLPLPEWRTMRDYQLCYWYCLEIERRVNAYETLLLAKSARVVRVSLPELTTLRGLRRLLEELELPQVGLYGWLRWLLVRSRKINTKLEKKRPSMPDGDIDDWETEVRSLVRNTTASSGSGSSKPGARASYQPERSARGLAAVDKPE